MRVRRMRRNPSVLWIIVIVLLLMIHKNVIFSKEPTPSDETSGSTEGYQTEKLPSLQDEKTADAVSVMIWQDGVAVEWDLEEYLVGVLAAEMPASFPEEALKAQAVAARSFILYRVAHPPQDGVHDAAPLCSAPAHCKGYYPIEEEGKAAELWGVGAETYLARLQLAVAETAGQVLVYDEEPALAAFHAISGGRTESAETVWGSAVPYLIEVDSPGEEDARRYEETVLFDRQALKTLLLSAYPGAALSDDPEAWLTDIRRSASGTIMSLQVGGILTDGAHLRSLLELNSADFTLHCDGDVVALTTTGYGHGVGMSQYGARAMAQSGAGYRDILQHYYPGCTLETVENLTMLAKN